MPKYPDIKVKLTGGNGNAFAILGSVQSAMKRAKLPDAEIKQFMDDATSGDYDNLLRVCMAWVNVC